MNFGEHVTIDGYKGSFNLLDSKDIVLKALQELPSLLDMHVLAPAQVFYAAGNDSKDPGGWSGYVIIMESHISIHTFPKRGFLSADVYTCKNGLDVAKIEAFFKERFGLQEIEKNLIQRGARYPESDLY